MRQDESIEKEIDKECSFFPEGFFIPPDTPEDEAFQLAWEAIK